jgi:predicted DCC family thiol-disulfide oxidoreductase YuxK
MSDLPGPRNLVVFDDVCVLCSGFARLVLRADREGRFRFTSARSPLGRAVYERLGLDPEAMETNVVVVDGRPHLRLASFAAAMGALGWPWRALAAVGWLPRRVADPLYGLIARNRYRLLGRRACPLPPADLRGRLLDGP